jgi:ribosomal-protein-alanine N-acetyltransferase
VTRDGVTIRSAGLVHLEFIRNLSERVFSQYGPYEEILSEWFESGITITHLALMDQRPVGFAMLKKPEHSGHAGQMSELLAIAVEREYRRLGIGDLLMREIQKDAEKMHVNMLLLSTEVGNHPAQSLFSKHGFTPWKLKKGYYPKGQEAVMMYKIVHRDVFSTT